MMDLAQKFRDFAAAFEEAYASDDWSRLAPFFTEDAVYYYSDGSEAVSGRSAVLQKLQEAVNELDRKMDQRGLEFHDISVAGDTVTAPWTARFSMNDIPPLNVTGQEVARYSGEAISELKSEITEESLAAFGAWMEEHGQRL